VAERFLQRWSRCKAEASRNRAPPGTLSEHASPASPASVDAAPENHAREAMPTLADVACLTVDSDFSGFFAQGVAADVRRAALKRLFADPHFNIMDGLDIYIADYTLPSPMSAAMLAGLQHVQSVLPPLRDEQAEAEAQDGIAPEDIQLPAGKPTLTDDSCIPSKGNNEADNEAEAKNKADAESKAEAISEAEAANHLEAANPAVSEQEVAPVAQDSSPRAPAPLAMNSGSSASEPPSPVPPTLIS
jgi:hypothetical protein